MLKLKFAVAIIANNDIMFKDSINEVIDKNIEELSWLRNRNPRDMREFMGNQGRELMVHALFTCVHDGDQQAVDDIVCFASELRIILHVTEHTLRWLVSKRDFKMMRQLIESKVYFQELVMKTTSEDLEMKKLRTETTIGKSEAPKLRPVTKERHLKVSDFIAYYMHSVKP